MLRRGRSVREAAFAPEALEQRRRVEELGRILDRMTEKRRVAFVLYEVYGHSGSGWTKLDSASGTYLEGAGCTAPADGRTFWGYAVPNSITLKAAK